MTSSNITYSSIIPLIGGETIAIENVLKKRPEYIMSYNVFKDHDKHLLEHYDNKVPYHVLDDGSVHNLKTVDIVNSVCPCAGLSSLSASASADNEINDWLMKASKFVLEDIKPKVYWGENAPRLATASGAPVVDKLRKIADDNGYTFSLYKTKSLIHGLGQVRNRAFYFFWKGNKVPIFEYYKKDHQKIEDLIKSVTNVENDPMSELINKKTPSKDCPFYRFILEEVEKMTHQEFQQKLTKGGNIQYYLEENSSYYEFAKWAKRVGDTKSYEKALRIISKFEDGKSIMRRGSEMAKDYIGAFVGHLPASLVHPVEDRYLTYREALTIMKMPLDFQLINPKKNLNHICQNVPVTTAEDMTKNVRSFIEDKLELVDYKFVIQDNKSRKIDYIE